MDVIWTFIYVHDTVVVCVSRVLTLVPVAQYVCMIIISDITVVFVQDDSGGNLPNFFGTLME